MPHPDMSRFRVVDNDGLLTVAALILGFVTSVPFGRHSAAHSNWELVLVLAAWVPLLVRTRWPLPVAVVVAAFDTAHVVVAAHRPVPSNIIPIATMLALYTVAVHLTSRVAWAAAVVAAAVQLTVTAVSSLGASADALAVNWPVIATVVGRLIAERRARIEAAEQRAAAAEATKAAEAQRQVTAERLRIAHDLHDVLAHHIAVVNAQSGVAHYLLRTDPDAAEKALAGIADNSRAALDDLRVTLGLLRSPSDPTDSGGERRPTPGIDQLSTLVTTFRDAGYAVDLAITGTARPLATAADLALYRITQEALTNACKHAPGSHASVALDWAATAVSLTVTNTASAQGPVIEAGTRNGLIGMQERAAAAGGTVSAEPGADGGFRVAVTLPVTPSRPSDPAPARPGPKESDVS